MHNEYISRSSNYKGNELTNELTKTNQACLVLATKHLIIAVAFSLKSLSLNKGISSEIIWQSHVEIIWQSHGNPLNCFLKICIVIRKLIYLSIWIDISTRNFSTMIGDTRKYTIVFQKVLKKKQRLVPCNVIQNENKPCNNKISVVKYKNYKYVRPWNLWLQ